MIERVLQKALCFQSSLDYQARQNDNFLAMIHFHVLALRPQNPFHSNFHFGKSW